MLLSSKYIFHIKKTTTTTTTSTTTKIEWKKKVVVAKTKVQKVDP